MNKRRIIILSIIVLLVASSLLYVSYGYLLARVEGNTTAKKFASLSQILKVEYSGGNNMLTSNIDEYFIPGSELVKTFTIKNTGNVRLNFSINLKDVVNNFIRIDDLVYELYLEDNLIISDVLPNYDSVIAYNQTLAIDEEKTYTLKVIYKTSSENQIIDQGKNISANIDFIEQEKSISNIKILGNSIQDGVPSLTNPVEIQSVGDMTKNIFNADELSFFDKQEDGSYLSNTRILTSHHLMENLTGTYTISAKIKSPVGRNYRLYVKYTDGTSKDSYKSSTGEYLNFTITTNGKDISYIGFAYGGYSSEVQFKDLQIEEGTSATEYEPYNKYKVPIKISAVNLFDSTNLEQGGAMDATGVNASSNYRVRTKELVELNAGTYRISSDKVNFRVIHVYNSDTEDYENNFWCNNKNSYTFTLEEKKKVKILFQLNSGNTNPLTVEEVQDGNVVLEKLNDKNFSSITKTVFLDEPLRKVGEYEDYIDFKNKKVVREIKKDILSTTLTKFACTTSWDNETHTTCYYNAEGRYINIRPLNTHFKNINDYHASISETGISQNGSNAYIYFRLDKTIASDKTSFNTWLSELSSPIEVIYPLTTSYVLINEENINLPSINIIDPNRNITIGTTIQPTIEISY